MMLLSAWLSVALLLVAAPLNPATIADHGTIELLTIEAGAGEHWSTVWFVVIDGALYVRLGPRAAGRIERNSTAPRMQVRVSGKAIHPMRYEETLEMAERIATAMDEKYWSDFLGEPFRKLGLTAKPLMLRLVPEPGASAP